MFLKHETVNKENIKILMYRLQKMYQLKADVRKILSMFLQLEHNCSNYVKTKEDQAKKWNRIAMLISQFETEHHGYHKLVFDAYDLKRYAIM